MTVTETCIIKNQMLRLQYLPEALIRKVTWCCLDSLIPSENNCRKDVKSSGYLMAHADIE